MKAIPGCVYIGFLLWSKSVIQSTVQDGENELDSFEGNETGCSALSSPSTLQTLTRKRGPNQTKG